MKHTIQVLAPMTESAKYPREAPNWGLLTTPKPFLGEQVEAKKECLTYRTVILLKTKDN